jgi:glycosyltransferase 2 family protein
MTLEAGGRRWAWTLIRISVAVVALGYTLNLAPRAEILAALGRLDLLHALGGVAFLLATVPIGGLRWRWALKAFGAEALPSLGVLTRLHLIGLFFNTFVPGGVGGDALRASVTQRAFSIPAAAWLAVIAERLLGLAALMTYATGIVALTGPLDGIPAWLFPALTLTLLTVTLVMPVVLGRLKTRLGLGQLAVAPLLGVYGISIAAHTCIAFAGATVARVTAPSATLVDSLIVVPLAQVAVFFPATVGGLGVREAAFVALYTRRGLDPSEAAAIAFGYLAIYLSAASLGGIAHMMAPVTLEPLTPATDS